VLAIAGCGGGLGDAKQSADDTGGIGPGATTTGEDDGTGEAQTGAADSAAGDGETGAADGPGADEGEVPIKFDLGILPDVPEGFGCSSDGKGGDLEYSYIWIANSTQNTVSKINTQTLVEEGRYYTRPDQFGNPSRTSVNLSGDVAVANRSGGLTKYYANPEDCVDADGDGTIETSSGAGDILPWDAEECRAWHTPFTYSSQRPVAWSQGEWSAAACAYQNQKVWTTGLLGGTIEVVLVDGELGVVEDSVLVPEVPSDGFGFYGGAVDAEGNFWASQLGGGQLIRVDIDDLTDYSLWPAPYGGYGMTVGASGYVFTCSFQVGRFDPATETWTGATVGGGGGCMEDSNGILWMANSPLVGVDVETLAPVYTWPLPQYVHGVSIDFDGSVWGVSMGTDAYKVDPTTGAIETVSGLVGPYTYSDMTGFALSSVGGGGAPSG
jgi:hypothetical protein